MRLIDADDFGNRMYHEAFEKDSDLQKWDSGCWIRYKLFENVLREQPTAQPETNCSEIPNSSDDTISRRAALDAIMGQPPEPHYPSWYATQIEKLPAVQPDLSGYSDRLWKSAYERGKAEAQAERKQGHWLINSDGYYPYCSECKSEPKSGDMTDFCPSCGADMRGGDSE